MSGKEKCRALREIRMTIAQANGIEFDEQNCTHEGPCAGTCPKCEQEARRLDAQLQKRVSQGKKIALAGLCVGMIAAVSGCTAIDAVLGGDPAEKTPVQTQKAEPTQPAGDDAFDEILIMGELPVEQILGNE